MKTTISVRKMHWVGFTADQRLQKKRRVNLKMQQYKVSRIGAQREKTTSKTEQKLSRVRLPTALPPDKGKTRILEGEERGRQRK